MRVPICVLRALKGIIKICARKRPYESVYSCKAFVWFSAHKQLVIITSFCSARSFVGLEKTRRVKPQATLFWKRRGIVAVLLRLARGLFGNEFCRRRRVWQIGEEIKGKLRGEKEFSKDEILTQRKRNALYRKNTTCTEQAP